MSSPPPLSDTGSIEAMEIEPTASGSQPSNITTGTKSGTMSDPAATPKPKSETGAKSKKGKTRDEMLDVSDQSDDSIAPSESILDSDAGSDSSSSSSTDSGSESSSSSETDKKTKKKLRRKVKAAIAKCMREFKKGKKGKSKNKRSTGKTEKGSKKKNRNS